MSCTFLVNNDQPQRLAAAGMATRTVTRPVVSKIGFGVTVTVAPRMFMAWNILLAMLFASPTFAPGTITRRAAS